MVDDLTNVGKKLYIPYKTWGKLYHPGKFQAALLRRGMDLETARTIDQAFLDALGDVAFKEEANYRAIEDWQREADSSRGFGQLLVLTATSDSIAHGGDFIEFDTINYQEGFADVLSASSQFTWPDNAVGAIGLELEWATYTGGGTVEVYVDGILESWGVLGSGISGTEGRGIIPVHIGAKSKVKIKVTQNSGAAQLLDATLRAWISDPVNVFSRAYRELILLQGPILYWRLGESSGTTVNDAMGTYNGTYSGIPSLGQSPLIQDGDSDTSVYFDGSNDEATYPDTADLEFQGLAPFSVSVLAKLDPLATGPYSHVIACKQDYAAQSGPNYGWILAATTDSLGNVELRVERWENISDAARSGFIFEKDVIYHIVGTFDGSTLKLYVNGSLIDSRISSKVLATTSAPLEVGHRTASLEHFKGTLDELAIFDYALSVDEVVAQYEASGL